MKPIFWNENTGVFRACGRLIGIREIGTRKSWYRWRTPDGKKWRSAKAAIAHVQQDVADRMSARVASALQSLGRLWHAKVQVA